MTVYIITKQSFPNGMAGTNRIKCFAKAILSQGISCKILVYQRTEVYGKNRNNKGKGIVDKIEFEYIGKTASRSNHSFIRKYYDLIDKINTLLFLYNKLKKDDIVIGYAGFDARFINHLINITHIKKAKYVRELCELPYGTGQETKQNVRKRLYTLKTQFPKCDGIIAISDSLKYLAQRYVNPNCIIIKTPILVDFEKYYMEDRSSQADIPYIFHSGTLFEQKDGILGMLKAFGKATQKLDENIHFISTGTPNKSPHYHDIERIIKDYQLEDRVTFTGYLSNEQLKDYLSKASLTIINKYTNQQNTYCFSTKLGEYLAAGKPVIITKVGEAMNWLKDGENAYIIEPNDTELLAKTIVEAFKNSEKRERIGKNGQDVCRESFDYKQYGSLLKRLFSQLTQ